MVDAAQLAAEQEAGLLQQQVGIGAAVSFPQAGLRLLQEKLETQRAGMRAAAPGTGRAGPAVPSLPASPYLGVTGTLQLEEQLGDLAQGTGRAQAVPERAAQGSDQEVALHGL